ncbi:MAG: hypothetical protein H6581_26535 [Bacteroidia bacterium]|nr:hypothetical protein [Bacteroidia bacterium]
MKYILLTIFGLFFGGLLSAQHLYFCEENPATNFPADTSQNWRLSITGGYIFMLFVPEKPFEDDELEIRIDSWVENKYEPVDTLTWFLEKGKNRALYELFLEGKGRRRIQIRDSSDQLLAEDTLHLIPSYMGEISPHFRGSQVTFCDSSLQGAPVNPDSIFRLRDGKKKLFALLKSPKKFGEYGMLIDLWHWKEGEWSPLHSGRYQTSPFWEFTQVPFNFTEKGRYRVDFFTRRGIWISSGEVEIQD